MTRPPEQLCPCPVNSIGTFTTTGSCRVINLEPEFITKALRIVVVQRMFHRNASRPLLLFDALGLVELGGKLLACRLQVANCQPRLAVTVANVSFVWPLWLLPRLRIVRAARNNVVLP